MATRRSAGVLGVGARSTGWAGYNDDGVVRGKGGWIILTSLTDRPGNIIYDHLYIGLDPLQPGRADGGDLHLGCHCDIS